MAITTLPVRSFNWGPVGWTAGGPAWPRLPGLRPRPPVGVLPDSTPPCTLRVSPLPRDPNATLCPVPLPPPSVATQEDSSWK